MLMHTRKGTTIVTQQEKVTNETRQQMNNLFQRLWSVHRRTGYFLPGGAVNHLRKKFLQVAQIFTKQSNRNEDRCNNIGRTGI